MEEKKSKVVEIKPQTEETVKSDKMSYEQLEQVAHQLSEQARQLYNKLQETNLNNMFKRLDYLFKIVENGHMFNSDFLNKCIKEIENIITIPDKSENNKGEESNNEYEEPNIIKE